MKSNLEFRIWCSQILNGLARIPNADLIDLNDSLRATRWRIAFEANIPADEIIRNVWREMLVNAHNNDFGIRQ